MASLCLRRRAARRPQPNPASALSTYTFGGVHLPTRQSPVCMRLSVVLGWGMGSCGCNPHRYDKPYCLNQPSTTSKQQPADSKQPDSPQSLEFGPVQAPRSRGDRIWLQFESFFRPVGDRGAGRGPRSRAEDGTWVAHEDEGQRSSLGRRGLGRQVFPLAALKWQESAGISGVFEPQECS